MMNLLPTWLDLPLRYLTRGWYEWLVLLAHPYATLPQVFCDMFELITDYDRRVVTFDDYARHVRYRLCAQGLPLMLVYGALHSRNGCKQDAMDSLCKYLVFDLYVKMRGVQLDPQVLDRCASEWCDQVPTFRAHELTFEDVASEIRLDVSAQLVLEWAMVRAAEIYAQYIQQRLLRAEVLEQAEVVGLFHCFVPINQAQPAATARKHVDRLVSAGVRGGISEFARTAEMYSTSQAHGVLLWLTTKEFARLLRRAGIKEKPDLGLVMLQETSSGISMYVVCALLPPGSIKVTRDTLLTEIGAGLRDGIARDQWNRARLEISEWGQEFLAGKCVC